MFGLIFSIYKSFQLTSIFFGSSVNIKKKVFICVYARLLKAYWWCLGQSIIMLWYVNFRTNEDMSVNLKFRLIRKIHIFSDWRFWATHKNNKNLLFKLNINFFNYFFIFYNVLVFFSPKWVFIGYLTVRSISYPTVVCFTSLYGQSLWDSLKKFKNSNLNL